MERIIKTELQPDGQMLLYYVDENGSTEQGILATVEGEEDGQSQTYTIVEEVDDSMIQYEVATQEEVNDLEQGGFREKWTEEETRRALIFFIDNKETFRNGQTKKKHLWTVACKTMLPHKNPTVCETKIRNLKRRYSLMHAERLMTNNVAASTWQFFDLCHQAFHDDINVIQAAPANENPVENVSIQSRNGVLTISPQSNKLAKPDPVIEKMLQLYCRCKKAAPKINERWSKTIFQKIAVELGDTAEYWHKRFLNFKYHYVKILEKHRMGSLTQSERNWPYLDIFEKIYEGDKEFHSKYNNIANIQAAQEIQVQFQEVQVSPVTVTEPTYITDEIIMQEVNLPLDWNMTEKTVLVKYYFDSFDEYQDPTIPDSYLWSEIGRLLDKTPEQCKNKYEELKDAHLNEYIMAAYDLNGRNPIAILYDNIISKEVKRELADTSDMPRRIDVWPVDQVDSMVQFFFDNLTMFKDSMCHYVCWAAVSKKLDEPIHNCRLQWMDLTSLYKSILNDKKENPEMQIDWRYTDIFDRIFDYGTDTKLLDELFDKGLQTEQRKEDVEVYEKLPVSDDEDYDPKDPGKRTRGTMEPKQYKILEYYLKNKDKFSANQRVKKSMWQELAKEIGLSPDNCAHRFRNLKQVYMAYIQREMNTPEKPILWPYYEYCKKVFGYRAVKTQLKKKSDKSDFVSGEWTPKEIKTLIKDYASQYNASKGVEDKLDWSAVSQELKRTETACRDKFVDLRKSYRQIKTMVNRGGKCRVTWKYYHMFDAIYTQRPQQKVEMEKEEEVELELEVVENDMDVSEVELNPQENEVNEEHNLTQVFEVNQDEVNQVEVNQDEVNQVDEVNQEQVKKELVQLNNVVVEGANQLMDFESAIDNIGGGNVAPPEMHVDDETLPQEENYYYDDGGVIVLEQGLKYYLEHVEEFVHPKYDKNYSWSDLCRHVSESTNMIVDNDDLINKINFMKQGYSDEGIRDMICADLVKEILEREYYLEISLETEQRPITEDDTAVSWSDEEIEQLLKTYLDNLDKFKNPKYVRSYLWLDISKILQKNPVACSRKMTEIRQIYRSIVKGKSENLSQWKFYGLCRQIYGDGTKSTSSSLLLTD